MYRPLAPPSQVPAPPPVSRVAGRGIIRPQWPPAACPAAAFPARATAPTPKPRPSGRDRSISPWNCLARSRQARDPGKRPASLTLTRRLAQEARALRGPSRATAHFPSHGLWFASWPPPPLWRRWRLRAHCGASCTTSSWVSRRAPLTKWLQVWRTAPCGFRMGPTRGGGLSTAAGREGSEEQR